MARQYPKVFIFLSEGPLIEGGAPMDDSKELEKKLGRYLALGDWPSTWAEIYNEGGMELMREYCKRLEPLGTDEAIYAHRIVARYWCGAGAAAQSEAEILKLIDEMPERYRPQLLKNPHCTERVVEMLWVGNYVLGDDTPYLELAVGIAFFNHYYKVLAVFLRRPDLRDVPEYLLELIMAGLALEGMSIQDSEEKTAEDSYHRAN